MRVRQLLKDVLWRFNVRILYSRITLNRFTTCYFFLALASCLVQVILQAATFTENAQFVQMMSTILTEAKVPQGFPIIQNNTLQICDSIPGQVGTDCMVVSGQSSKNSTFKSQAQGSHDQAASGAKVGRRALTGEAQFKPSGNLRGVSISDGASPPQTLSDQCVLSLTWLDYILRDAKSEDAVTLAFQIWLLGLSLVTILNESIPHLFAVVASHILDTVWAGFRVNSTSQTRSLYEKFVVNNACNGVDILKPLWDARMSNTIAIVTINCVTFLGVLYLSFNLFKVYKAQTVKRVGTSTQVNTVYTLVLLFSVSLQLAGFFILSSTALWIEKVSSGAMRRVANNFSLYQVAFVVTAILEIPWLVLGWNSIRREKRNLFAAFFFLGLILVAVSSAMFAGALYRFVFNTWSFFATMTVFAYIQLVLTSILGILCRLKFGNGLTDYLTVSEKTEDLSFDPVHMANRLEESSPNEPFLPFYATDSEKNIFQEIIAPAPAVIKGSVDSPPKSMLRRPSDKLRHRDMTVTFVDSAWSTAPESTRHRSPLPTSPAETLDNIVLSYGNMSSGSSLHTIRPRSRVEKGRLTPFTPPISPTTSLMSLTRHFPTRVTSRWSMSTAADDAAHAGPSMINFSVFGHPAKKVIAGLPSNPRPRN